jgi:hypothetical protein
MKLLQGRRKAAVTAGDRHEYCMTPSSIAPNRSETMSSA